MASTSIQELIEHYSKIFPHKARILGPQLEHYAGKILQGEAVTPQRGPAPMMADYMEILKHSILWLPVLKALLDFAKEIVKTLRDKNERRDKFQAELDRILTERKIRMKEKDRKALVDSLIDLN